MGFHAIAMKTHLISAYNYPRYNLSQNQKPQNSVYQKPEITKLQSKSQVNFTGSRVADYLIRSVNLDPLYHFTNFTKSEYSRLSVGEIEKLRAKSLQWLKGHSSDGIRAMDDIHNYSSAVIKDMFDGFFGEGKYVVITIGRSLSTIGKSLGYKIGEENVVNIPMSSASRFFPGSTRVGDHYAVYSKLNNERLDKFLSYLNKLGLSKEQVEKSGKNYIIMDYCYSGDSLKGAEFLFKSDFVWGPKAKVHAADFLKVIEKYSIPQVRKEPVLENQRVRFLDIYPILQRALCGSQYQPYSFVSQCMKLGDTEGAAKIIRKPMESTKELMWFRLLDNAMRPEQLHFSKIIPIEKEIKVSGQNTLPWHNYLSQTECDIRNDIQRLNAQLVKLDLMPELKGPEYREVTLELNYLYNSLTDCYNNYKSNPYTVLGYYESRNRIHQVLDKVENTMQRNLNSL